MHGAAFLGYYGNLARPYAVGVSSDRSLGVGMAMAVADGGSPFNHVQIEFGNLEPMWTYTVAALSGFSSTRTPLVYDNMTWLVLALTALGFYRAWSLPAAGEDPDVARWRGVLVAASTLGLSSMALAPDGALAPFWQANFVFKPNHAIAFGLVGLVSRFQAARDSWWKLGLVLGLLMWAFILDWAYALPALAISALLGPRPLDELKKVAAAIALSLTLGAPYLVHLLKDYNPMGKGEMPQIWRDSMGDRLTNPYWWSLDYGPLLALFLIGLVVAFRRGARGDREERGALGFLLTAPIVGLSYVIGLRFGFAPEPDEGFYYVRMVLAAGAGYAAWELAPRFARGSRPRFALAFAAVLAGSLPGHFNPNLEDRYYRHSLYPIPAPALAVSAWLRANTTVRDVCVSAEGIMLSGLSGRRFLMVRPEQTADRRAREEAERDILTSRDEAVVRRAATRYGVTHIVLDDRLREAYGPEAVKGLGNRGWFEPMFANSFARIVALRPAGRLRE